MLEKTFRPFQHALVQHQQRFFQQNHVRGLFRDIDGRVHADAHVGCVKRRRVVDAIAHEADTVATRPQRLDDPLLVRRRYPRKQHRRLGGSGQVRVAHALHGIAEQNAIRRQPDVLANLAGYQLVCRR